MGELLRFPPRRDDGGRDGHGDEPSDGAQDDGAGLGPAPSGRPRPLAPLPSAPSGSADPQDAGTEREDGAEEPRWAVPGVDDTGAPPPPEPTRASRRASNVALAALTRHDASEGEVRAKLVAKELDEAEVEAELERLRRVGLLDDHAFALRQVERLRERKGLGDGAIRSALRTRLVPQDVVDAVLAEEVEDEDDAQDRLQRVADDRARRLGSLTYAVAERRLTAYLMRKGYGGSAVRTATRAALESVGIR